MTSDNPVQERIDALEADQDQAVALLKRTLRLARRQVARHPEPLPLALPGQTLRLALAFRRVEAAATELDDFINYLERQCR